jgi:hypothetical protein
LAGPIIRRAETSGIWIWLATSEPVYYVEPFLHPLDLTGKPDPRYDPGGIYELGVLTTEITPASFRCIQLGRKLYVTLFQMAPKRGQFHTDVILGYYFSVKTNSGTYNLKDLVTEGIYDLEESVKEFRRVLCYHPYPVPTLFLPSSDGNLAQASCRRPAGPGEDAFQDFDLLLAKVSQDLKRRPAALFLTGDQIYADWLAFPVFDSVRAIVPDIMGYEEFLPDVPYLGIKRKLLRADLVKYTFSSNEKETRRPVVLQADLTTDDGEGHLMTFGEFAAMYLLVWNPVLCDKYEIEKHNWDIIGGKKYPRKNDDDVKNLKDFTSRVSEARRVLANIPTYMAFDDHEITDDWNLNEDWIASTSKGLARRILTNGLAAFWFFQGWGNVPELQKGTGAQTTELVEKRLAAVLKSPIEAAIDEGFENAMLNREPYSFVAPTTPPVIVTDMRTHRDMHTLSLQPSNKDHSSLLNKKAYDHLAKICKELPKNKPIVFVSGSPVLNWYPTTTGRNLMISVDYHSGNLKVINEYEIGDLWDDHIKGRARFVQWIHDTLEPSCCVFFSGDVHHGSVIKAKASMKSNEMKELWSLDIVQITSSPMKNEAEKLSGKVIGVISKAELYDKVAPTSNTEEINFSAQEGKMIIVHEAIEMPGRLSKDSFLAKFFSRSGSGGSVIYHNHICVVDFTKKKEITANFFGSGMSCSGKVNI